MSVIIKRERERWMFISLIGCIYRLSFLPANVCVLLCNHWSKCLTLKQFICKNIKTKEKCVTHTTVLAVLCTLWRGQSEALGPGSVSRCNRRSRTARPGQTGLGTYSSSPAPRAHAHPETDLHTNTIYWWVMRSNYFLVELYEWMNV